MSQSAVVQHLYWINDQHKWVDLFTIPKDRCDTYNLCGPYAVCDINGSPNCNCMLGFEPKSAHDWELFVMFGGCVAKSPLDCGEGEGFVKYEGMKLPDATSLWINGSILGSDECEDICLKNCSCTGYSVINRNTGGNQKACFAWSGDLIDNREADNGHGQDLYVRLSASSLKLIDASRKRRRRKRRLIVIIAVSVLSVSFLFGLIFWFTIWLKKKTGSREGAQVNIAERNHHVENCEEDVEFPSFDLGTIVKATNEFSFSNKIGEGGFGPVYKGILPSGQEIAVKKLSLDSRQGFIELKNEVILISKLQHRNLVRLLGCCIHGEERMLIYEFMPNKSLDSFIFDKRRGSKLKWNLRYNIIIGIARGLLYLHQDSRLRIIHRDLKASNILLDKDMNPKISDFGLARSFGGDQTEEKTRMVVGTYGYMSPEYAVDGNFSVKSDVFSFGVLVLEIVSGRRNRGFYHDEHDLNLLGHAWKLWDEGKVMELLDLSMEGNYTVHEAVRCIHVGLLCVQKRAEDRPIMSSVLTMLDGGGPMLPEPKQPGFFTERGLSTETDSSSRQIQHVSSDQVSISMVLGR